jgi:hypothetical protein
VTVVDADTARAVADGVRSDRAEPGWAAARVGEPQLVRTVDGVPSYWVCPVVAEDGLRGFVRVRGDGRVAAYGATEPGRGPAVVTGITADDAARVARERAPGAAIGVPLYVHDGPPGREAWRVEVRSGDAVTVLMIGPGGAYEWARPGTAG